MNSFMTEVLGVQKPLICAENQWAVFYMTGTSAMKVLRCSSPIILRKSILTCCKVELFSVFFYLGFFHEYSRWEGGRYFFISFLPLSLASQACRHRSFHCCFSESLLGNAPVTMEILEVSGHFSSLTSTISLTLISRGVNI